MSSTITGEQAARIDAAAAVLIERKRIERLATEARIKAELDALELVGCETEGSRSASTDSFKITTTGKIDRKLDEAAWFSISQQIPEAIRNLLVRYRPELVTRELRFVQSNEPHIYRLLSEAITAKPAKASVAVARIEQTQARAA